MPKPMTCPRCGGGFDCGAQDGHCDCFALVLSPGQQADIAAHFADCLCVACLRQIADGAPAQAPAPQAASD
jgi:hypothetical protein